MCSYLISLGADVNCVSESGFYPLYMYVLHIYKENLQGNF